MNSPSLGPLIARGRTAEVYAWQDGQIVKLFYTWCPPQWVQNEIDIGHAISALPVPTPKLFASIEINGRQGIIYERVTGPSMLKLATSKPWLLFRMARLLAELQAEMHRQPGTGLPALRPSLEYTIKQVESLPADLKESVLRLLTTLPDGTALCHFDFHPDQVLITAKGPVILDWMTARQGHPLADVARTSIILKFSQVPGAGKLEQTIIDLWRRLFYRAYVNCYFELNPDATMSTIETWMVPVAASRLMEKIPGEQASLLDFIQSHLAER
ncbi:MAG TPA: aminoglycoside phosphotransferase family protein [Longilinea sp.]|nr:aminoglycoside phosphotransferase family protein [Longilinea sp.]